MLSPRPPSLCITAAHCCIRPGNGLQGPVPPLHACHQPLLALDGYVKHIQKGDHIPDTGLKPWFESHAPKDTSKSKIMPTVPPAAHHIISVTERTTLDHAMAILGPTYMTGQRWLAQAVASACLLDTVSSATLQHHHPSFAAAIGVSPQCSPQAHSRYTPPRCVSSPHMRANTGKL